MPYCEIETGLSLFYKSTGKGLPVVWIHPPHMGHRVFQYQHDLSSEHYRVITYDARGHGASGRGDGAVSIAILARDVAALLDGLGCDQAVICGYSAGGSVAQQFALTYPERTVALILSGGFPEVSTFLLKNQFRAGLNIVSRGGSIPLSRLLAASHVVKKGDGQMLFQECASCNPQMAYAFYAESFYYHCTHRLKEITCPVLGLYGQYCHTQPYARLYQEHLPQFQMVMIHRAGHQLPARRHHQVNHAVARFLQSLSWKLDDEKAE